MKTSDDVVEALGNLTRMDREWILDRLSPAARSTLVGTPTEVAPTKAVAQSRTETKNDSLAVVNVDDVAAILKREPAWVSHVILRQPQSWNAELREILPESMRQQVGQLNGAGVEYSRALIDSVEHELSRALANGPTEVTQSRIDRLIAGIGALLSRKRVNARIPA